MGCQTAFPFCCFVFVLFVLGIFHSYSDVTITDKGLEILTYILGTHGYWAMRVFMVPHLLWHGTYYIYIINKLIYIYYRLRRVKHMINQMGGGPQGCGLRRWLHMLVDVITVKKIQYANELLFWFSSFSATLLQLFLQLDFKVHVYIFFINSVFHLVIISPECLLFKIIC